MAHDAPVRTDQPAAIVGTDGQEPGYLTPQVDVAALTTLLDGEHAEVRNLVRSNLAAYSSILEDAEELTTEDFRERVKDVVVEMAATGASGMGFPDGP